MAPLTDAVSLVDHEARELSTIVEVSQSRQELVAGTQLCVRVMCTN